MVNVVLAQPFPLRFFLLRGGTFSCIFARLKQTDGTWNTEMTTISTKPAEVRREWYLVDAQGQTLGRLASELARRLRGKHKVQYTPHVDTGDYLIVVNAEKIRVTGNKLRDKMYHRHTGYVGNLKSISLGRLLAKDPEQVIRKAVKGMLPRGPLGRAMLRKLHVYAGPEHRHSAQQPKPLAL